MISKMPDWMSLEPGFKFYDDDGDLCIMLGKGGWRDFKHVNLIVRDLDGKDLHKLGQTWQLTLEPEDYLIAYNYKNEWHIGTLDNYFSDKEIEECNPFEHSIQDVSCKEAIAIKKELDAQDVPFFSGAGNVYSLADRFRWLLNKRYNDGLMFAKELAQEKLSVD